jgi:protein YIPF1/2
MMNSSYDDGDEFAPNPFRSFGGGSSGQQQQQQQPGDFFSASNTNAPSSVMVNQALNQPDPYSGMTGAMDYNQQMHQQHQMQQQQQMMMQQQQQQMQQQQQNAANWTGAMDSRAAPVENYGGATLAGGAGGGSGGEIPSTPFSIFSWRGCLSCFRLDSYGQYFNMDTIDIAQRLKSSLTIFWQPDQFRTAIVGDAPNHETGLKGPDLYGPVWIAMTLVFLLAVTSNMHDYWKHKKKQAQAPPDSVEEEFEVDFVHLLRASGIVFTFVFGMSTALWLSSNCMGMPGISWAMWTCCYGYAQTPFLFASLLVTLLPWPLASLIILSVAAAVSVLLILRNLSTPLLAQDSATHAKASPIILAILGGHVVYLIAIKVAFYK